MGQIYQAVDVPKLIEKFGIKNFVETGTGIGDSVEYILYSNDSSLNIYTIELMEELYRRLVARLGGFQNLRLINGYSNVEIAKVLKEMSSEPCLFWHDAHFPGADFGINGMGYGSEQDAEIRTPLHAELAELLKSSRDLSRDVLILDDLRIYKDGPYDGGIWHEREQFGCQGNEFVYEMFDKTHHIYESYPQQGFVIMFPRLDDPSNYEHLIHGRFVRMTK